MFIFYEDQGVLDTDHVPVRGEWIRAGYYNVVIKLKYPGEVLFSTGSSPTETVQYLYCTDDSECKVWAEITLNPENPKEQEVIQGMPFKLWDKDKIHILYIPRLLLDSSTAEKEHPSTKVRSVK